eukprot:659079-Amorphochlora_amoeboformis.AAC.1
MECHSDNIRRQRVNVHRTHGLPRISSGVLKGLLCRLYDLQGRGGTDYIRRSGVNLYSIVFNLTTVDVAFIHVLLTRPLSSNKIPLLASKETPRTYSKPII